MLAFNIIWLTWNFKDLSRRTAGGKALREKAFNIGKNPKYYGYQKGLPAMVITFLKKKSKGVAVACAWSKTLATCGKDAIKIKNRLNQQLSGELHKPVKLVWRC